MGQNFKLFVINSSKIKNRHTIWKITKFGKFYLQTSVDHWGQTTGPNPIPRVAGWLSLLSPPLYPFNFYF